MAHMNVASKELCQELRKQYHKEFTAWCNMRYRCMNTNHPQYPNYGGRGIKVHKQWLGKQGFEQFVTDLGFAPSKEYSLNRIDNDGNYEPDNCEWTTQKLQSNNLRKNILLTKDSKTQTLSEWADDLNINYATLYYRIKRGWSAERALCK